MTCRRETGQVEYRSKDGKQTRVFDALEWPRKMRGMRTLARHACLCVARRQVTSSRGLLLMIT